MVAKLRVYFDTTVLLDILEPTRDNRNSILLVDRIKKGPTIGVVVSTFSIMETVQKEKESSHLRGLLNRNYTLDEIRSDAGRQLDLSPTDTERCFTDVLEGLEALGNKLETVTLGESQTWIEASLLVRQTNVSAPDAIHVAAARTAGCSGFATGDGQLYAQIATTPRLRDAIVPILCQRSIPEAKFRRSLGYAIKKMEGRVASRSGLQISDISKVVGPKLSRFFRASPRDRNRIREYERALNRRVKTRRR